MDQASENRDREAKPPALVSVVLQAVVVARLLTRAAVLLVEQRIAMRAQQPVALPVPVPLAVPLPREAGRLAAAVPREVIDGHQHLRVIGGLRVVHG